MKITTKYIINLLKNKQRFKNFEKFSILFEKAFTDIFLLNSKKYSSLLIINTNKVFQNHPMYNAIFNFKHQLENTDKSPINHVLNTDDSFAIFFLGNWNLKCENEIILLLKNILLFREAVNFIGWEYIETYREYKIIKNVDYNEDYSVLFMPDDVPQISDDYLSVFLNFEENDFPVKKAIVYNFLVDFCNFIYELNLTNYRIDPIIDQS